MFLAAFGFFGAIVFLPRWFQVVAGPERTESGYNLLPLLGGADRQCDPVGPDRGPDAAATSC